jgi:hypothetical protein
VAGELTTRLTDALSELSAGRITGQQAAILAGAVAGLDDEPAAAVQQRVLPRAPQQTIAAFRASVARAVVAADPRSVEQQHADAMTRRQVCFTPPPDAMTELWALVPADGAAALRAALDARAAPPCCADDSRSADQRRADALVDLGAAALHDPSLPRDHGLRPQVQVTVALSTLLGLDEQPGELAGHGPIPAELARYLAADPAGTWRRLVTDPVTGDLLDYGRTTYRPPADLTDFIVARDRHCRFPGCGRAARRCDLDHRVPWEAGGTTNPANLSALCRRHHVMKHQAGWSYQITEDHSTMWLSPTGHRYVSRPLELPCDATTQTPPDARAEPEADPDPPPF